MPANYVLLQRIELSASASSVSFTNIPQSGYTDLKIVMSARSNSSTSNTGQYDVLLYRLNSTTTGYTSRYISGNGATPESNSNTTATSAGAGGTWGRLANAGLVNNLATASTFSNVEIYIPNYLSGSNKSISIDSVTEQNATNAIAEMDAALWSNTAAITSISFATLVGTAFMPYSTFSLYGIAAVGTTPVIAPKASGGNITTDGTYWIHTFNSTGAFTPSQALSCDYLVVAGGGGGGSADNSTAGGGGGGAGGFRTATAQSLTASTSYTVTIGGGGASNANGTNSSLNSFSATGGGRGASSATNGTAGGSGGGASRASSSTTGGAGNAGSYSPVEGYKGGDANANSLGAGGGGSSSAGVNATVAGTGTNGGNGTSNSYSGTSVTYAGGGGGGSYTGYPVSSGQAGGGNGGSGSANGSSATVNTGSGGGGAGGQTSGGYVGGAGGSGIVIIRYLVA